MTLEQQVEDVAALGDTPQERATIRAAFLGGVLAGIDVSNKRDVARWAREQLLLIVKHSGVTIQ